MKVISNPKELTREFRALMDKYDEFYWAAAWANTDCPLFKDLQRWKVKIKQLIVGTDFCGTDPEFIREFRNHEGFRIFPSGSGTFHPKVYLFLKNEKAWAALVGSANFTRGAFFNNKEIAVYFDSNQNGAKELRKEIMRIIDEYFQLGEQWNEEKFSRYVEECLRHKPGEDSEGFDEREAAAKDLTFTQDEEVEESQELEQIISSQELILKPSRMDTTPVIPDLGNNKDWNKFLEAGKKGEQWALKRIMFVSVSWMDHYDREKFPDEPFVPRGSYGRQYGHCEEIFNFKPENGYYYGSAALKGIDLTHFGVNGSEAKGILVVWLAREPENQNVRVVGWHRNADVFSQHRKDCECVKKRNQQIGTDQDRYGCWTRAKVKDGYLVETKNRLLSVEEKLSGQSSLAYGTTDKNGAKTVFGLIQSEEKIRMRKQ